MGLYYIIGCHFGDVIIKHIIQIIQEYRFEKILGYFVFNNTTSNNTCIKAIFNKI